MSERRGVLKINLEKVEKELAQAAVSYVPKSRPWTEQELKLLVRFHGRVSPRVIAEKLNRTSASIEHQVYDLRGKGLIPECVKRGR